MNRKPNHVLSPISAAGAIGFCCGALSLIASFWLRDSQLYLSFLPLLGGLALAYILVRRAEKDFKQGLGNIEDIIRSSTRAEKECIIPASKLSSATLMPLADAVSEYSNAREARIRKLSNDFAALKRVLKSMQEGVITIDNHEKIVKFNSAAREVLGIDKSCLGKPITEVIRNSDFQEIVRAVLVRNKKSSGEILIEGNKPQYLEVQAAPLAALDSDRESNYALVVLHDITRLRLLERVRKDFVANVSHELRTPVTSIRGFIETLSDGAIENAEDTKRFLEIMHRQTLRLERIIEELLLLSDLENRDERVLSRKRESLASLADSAIEVIQMRAGKRGVILENHIPRDLKARVRVALLEQAFSNLLDNAAKYSPDGERVTISTRIRSDWLQIIVTDKGPGIEEVHQDRLFERFYRIDRARTRKQGGTGLGLAIVKHIAQVHGGFASLESTPGRGSSFIIHLPVELATADQGHEPQEAVA